MKLDYIYHSGFAIGTGKITLIIDYFKDSSETNPGHGIVHDRLLGNPGEIYVLSSHFHPDHFNKEILSWKNTRPGIHYIFSRDILEHNKAGKEDAVYLDKSEMYSDEWLSVKAYGSTDAGISFLIQIEDYTIFHAGDLNNWHWNEESTDDEIKKAEDDYSNELEVIAGEVQQIDLVMFPVDPRLGKDYMKGAGQFISKIKTGIFVPMHFGESYDKANAFGTIARKYGVTYLPIQQRGQSYDITQ